MLLEYVYGGYLCSIDGNGQYVLCGSIAMIRGIAQILDLRVSNFFLGVNEEYLTRARVEYQRICAGRTNATSTDDSDLRSQA